MRGSVAPPEVGAGARTGRTLANQRGHILRLAIGLSSCVTACSEPRALPRAERAPALRASGEHEVQTHVAAPQIELSLNSGFSVRLSPVSKTARLSSASLGVAAPPVNAQAIHPAFVPIGPTVALRTSEARVEAGYVAEAFRVRTGHRLVLAVEQATPCQPTASCAGWQVRPASYSGGRCHAELIASTVRLQFGSVPVASVPASGKLAPLSDSAAP